jgi:hypothetical protein
MSCRRHVAAILAALVLALATSVAWAAGVERNYQGLWWNAPADSESGWGINFAHQGDIIFATWFTYDANGKAWWLAMTANKTADATYSGVLFDATGPAFSAVPFDSSKFKPAAVGNGTLQFTDENNATFSYTVNGITQTKSITRQVFGVVPTCMSAAKLDPVTATNYQDLWWTSPAGSESGWGINLTHQSDVIFATWFTYASDGTPMWLSVSAFKTADRTYAGDLARTTGPAFNSVPFNSKGVSYTKVGTATFTFTSGNQATFTYSVDGITQTKAIIREVFVAPGTVCTTAPVDTSTAKGIGTGATNLNESAFALVLDDGRFEFVYAKGGTSDDINVVIGTASTNGGTLSSADSTSYPIAQTAEATGFAAPASVTGTIVPGGNLNFTVASPVSTRSFAGSFVQGSDQAPSLADLAGSYSGATGHVGGRRDASMTIDAAGNVRGSNDALCAFVGTVTPRPAVRAFDWTIHANNLNCIFGRGPISGILYYDQTTGRLHAFAPFQDSAGGADQYFFVGTKSNR